MQLLGRQEPLVPRFPELQVFFPDGRGAEQGFESREHGNHPLDRLSYRHSRRLRSDTIGFLPDPTAFATPLCSRPETAWLPLDTSLSGRNPPRSVMIADSTELNLHLRLVSLLGIGVLIFLAWLISSNRRQVPWRVVVCGDMRANETQNPHGRSSL